MPTKEKMQAFAEWAATLPDPSDGMLVSGARGMPSRMYLALRGLGLTVRCPCPDGPPEMWECQRCLESIKAAFGKYLTQG